VHLPNTVNSRAGLGKIWTDVMDRRDFDGGACGTQRPQKQSITVFTGAVALQLVAPMELRNCGVAGLRGYGSMALRSSGLP
jgi:hypothetical protein